MQTVEDRITRKEVGNKGSDAHLDISAGIGVGRVRPMAALPYMQFYVGDYLADTGHLTTVQHGAYLLLMLNYWRRGEALADDDARLSATVKMTKRVWLRNRQVLAEFFEVSDGVWRHKRIEKDLKKSGERSSKARESRMQALNERHNEGPTNVERTLNERHNERRTDVERTFNHIRYQKSEFRFRTFSTKVRVRAEKIPPRSPPQTQTPDRSGIQAERGGPRLGQGGRVHRGADPGRDRAVRRPLGVEGGVEAGMVAVLAQLDA